MQSDSQYSLFGGSPPHVANSDTSAAAADGLDNINAMQQRVFRLISASLAGLTCDDVERLLDMKHQTASARIRELVLLKRIVDSGQRRLTRSNRKARIYMEAHQ